MSAIPSVWLEDLLVRSESPLRAGALVVIRSAGVPRRTARRDCPLKTDALTARALAQKLIERPAVIAAPIVGFGFYPAFTPSPAASTFRPPRLKRCWPNYWAISRGHGVKRIVLLNTGVSTEKPIDEVTAGAT